MLYYIYVHNQSPKFYFKICHTTVFFYKNSFLHPKKGNHHIFKNIYCRLNLISKYPLPSSQPATRVCQHLPSIQPTMYANIWLSLIAVAYYVGFLPTNIPFWFMVQSFNDVALPPPQMLPQCWHSLTPLAYTKRLKILGFSFFLIYGGFFLQRRVHREKFNQLNVGMMSLTVIVDTRMMQKLVHFSMSR